MKSQKQTRHPSRPIPEAINGKPWTVKIIQKYPGQTGPEGWTDTTKHEMALPSDDAENARFVRLHELMHAAITPPGSIDKLCKKNKILPHDLQVCEDLRVHTALYRKRILPKELRTSRTDSLKSIATAMANTIDHHALLEDYAHLLLQHTIASSRGLVSYGQLYNDYQRLQEYIKQSLVGVQDADLNQHNKLSRTATNIGNKVAKALIGRSDLGVPEFKRTIKAAKLLRKLLTQAHSILDAEDEDMARRAQLLMNDKRSDGKWGQLKDIRKLRLEKMRKIEGNHRRRSLLQGTRIGALHRLLTDGKAFKRKTKRQANQGGTFLIDASGSMSIKSSAIARILQETPAAKVAIYCANGERGNIAIIAEDGRMASEEAIREFRDKTGECNTIDGPVLRWLGQQAQPRIWICDGFVTGVGDHEAANLTIEATTLAKMFNIKRIQSLEHLQENKI